MYRLQLFDLPTHNKLYIIKKHALIRSDLIFMIFDLNSLESFLKIDIIWKSLS